MKKSEFCTFCNKSIEKIDRMIAAPNHSAYICDECVELAHQIMLQEREAENGATSDLNETALGLNGMTPKQIRKELDKYIVGQDKAKKVLSVAIYNHNKRLNDKTGLIKKSNILIAGPTGSGKTLLAKTLAKILNVPFAIADATSLTEAGYVGDDVEICVQKLIYAAGNDIELAQNGIIYIDEIDKIARAGENKSITRDVSGEGVQQALLKLIEGCEINVPLNDRRKHPNGNNVPFDTTNVLFICGGAFEGLFENKGKNPFGFDKTVELSQGDNGLNPQSLKKFGMLPELIGRLPVLCSVEGFDEVGLMKILTEPADAITKEYELLFAQEGVKLTYEEDALREIASISLKRNTGARGLRSILEDVMLDIMYDLPDERNITECIITKDTIISKQPILVRKMAS